MSTVTATTPANTNIDNLRETLWNVKFTGTKLPLTDFLNDKEFGKFPETFWDDTVNMGDDTVFKNHPLVSKKLAKIVKKRRKAFYTAAIDLLTDSYREALENPEEAAEWNLAVNYLPPYLIDTPKNARNTITRVAQYIPTFITNLGIPNSFHTPQTTTMDEILFYTLTQLWEYYIEGAEECGEHYGDLPNLEETVLADADYEYLYQSPGDPMYDYIHSLGVPLNRLLTSHL